MFMLTHDGGLPTNSGDSLQTERILVQRIGIFDTMVQAIAIVLLQTADFKDGKVSREFFIPLLQETNMICVDSQLRL